MSYLVSLLWEENRMFANPRCVCRILYHWTPDDDGGVGGCPRTSLGGVSLSPTFLPAYLSALPFTHPEAYRMMSGQDGTGVVLTCLFPSPASTTKCMPPQTVLVWHCRIVPAGFGLVEDLTALVPSDLSETTEDYRFPKLSVILSTGVTPVRLG